MQTTKEKVDTSKPLDASLVDKESSKTESKERYTNRKSGNDAHADDADIRTMYDEEPMAEVQTTAEINVFATGQQHSEQPEFNNERETYYKYQDFRIKKAQELRTKTSANSKIKDNSSETKLQGRLLKRFQEDAKYEHVGQDTRSQGGKDYQDKQGKDLEISKSKTKLKDNDKGSRSKIIQHEGTSLQHNKEQRFTNSTTKQSQQVQGSKIQDLTSRIQRPNINKDC
uniref:Uncharacterized protein n=1 Tax=Tanacetum cinerariifolium TaxID=118510 RepID=A0A6L2NEV5_TANCI|nr:hypothetical protein [Tanacetum cinerariifolium]